ncbi:hypothetical protein RCL1_000093 [Eukaryota sp. TZLM3-RCL]
MSEILPQQSDSVLRLEIDGKSFDLSPDLEGQNLIEVASSAGINIPHFCYHKDTQFRTGHCGICIVEVQRQDDEKPKLVKACQTPAESFMKVSTNSRFVRKARLDQLSVLSDMQDRMKKVPRAAPHSELHKVAEESRRWSVDSSEALEIDRSMCVSCKRCVTACSNIQEQGVLRVVKDTGLVDITPLGVPLQDSGCLSCGQCSLYCPTGAVKEKSDLSLVEGWIKDPSIVTVVQVAPSVRVQLGEEIGLQPGIFTDWTVAALRDLGFDHVFDTQFGADLTIMEEGHEFLKRFVDKTGPLPLFTSCCPAWITFVEKNAPDLLPNISSVRSPHMIVGSLVKSYWSLYQNIDPATVRVVSIMPCVAKKSEVKRHQFARDAFPPVDAVLTTRELGEWMRGTWMDPVKHLSTTVNAQPAAYSKFDSCLGYSSGSAAIFSRSGGVMTAALRTIYHILTGRELLVPLLKPVPHIENVSEAWLTLPIGDETHEIHIGVCDGIASARKLLLQGDVSDFHFIEVMTCIHGCICGSGGPKFSDREKTFAARVAAVQQMDSTAGIKTSDENPEVKEIYSSFLEKPGSETAEKLLHTSYESTPPAKAPAKPEVPKTETKQVKPPAEESSVVKIVYISTTGTSEELANVCGTELRKAGFEVDVQNVEDIDLEYDLHESKALVFFASTYGVGNYADSGIELKEYLDRPSHQVESFSETHYAVFGLGSSSFPNFCAAGNDLDSKLSGFGATRLLDVVNCDTSKADNVSPMLESFIEELVTLLPPIVGAPKAVEIQPPAPKYRVVTSLGQMAYPPPCLPAQTRCKLKSIVRITPEDYPRVVYHVKIDTAGKLAYHIGDAFALQPLNSEQDALTALSLLKLNPEQLMTALPLENARKYPPRLTWKMFFREYIALQGIPNRRLCADLAFFCSGEDKSWLLRLGSKEGAEELKQWITDGNRVIDLLQRLSSLQLSPAMIPTLLPLNKPRLYSIASAPRVFTTEVHFAIVKITYTTPSGRYMEGVTGRYLTELHEMFTKDPNAEHYVCCSVVPGTLKFPTDPERPMIIVALGTGLAPFLSHLQERERLMKAGKKIGNCLMYYGCRHNNKDFLFKDQIIAWKDSGVITNLEACFSHDQKEFITPLTLISNNPNLPFEYMKNSDFSFYYCGPAMGIPQSIEKLFVDILVSNGLDPDLIVTNAKKEYRWNVEAF